MMFKLKYEFTFACYFLIALIGMSCGKESSCIKSTGDIKIEQRNVSAEVKKIRISEKIHFVFTQSNNLNLSVEGGKNLLPYINTKISGDELIISSDNKCNFLRDYGKPITVYLSLPTLSEIDYRGQGTITSTNTLNLTDFEFNSWSGTGSVNLNINANRVFIHQHSGPADFTLNGKVDYLYAYTLGNGWFHFNRLIAKSGRVNHKGSGDISVRVLNELNIDLISIGNVDYYGDPNLTVGVHSGAGEIRKN